MASIAPARAFKSAGFAKAYAGLTPVQVEALLKDMDWIEICREAARQDTVS